MKMVLIILSYALVATRGFASGLDEETREVDSAQTVQQKEVDSKSLEREVKAQAEANAIVELARKTFMHTCLENRAGGAEVVRGDVWRCGRHWDVACQTISTNERIREEYELEGAKQ